MPRKVNIGGDSEFDLRVAISYTLLVLTLTYAHLLCGKNRYFSKIYIGFLVEEIGQVRIILTDIRLLPNTVGFIAPNC